MFPLISSCIQAKSDSVGCCITSAVIIGVVVVVATVILLIIIVAVFITVLASEGVGDGGECVTCHSSMGQCVCAGPNSLLR